MESSAQGAISGNREDVRTVVRVTLAVLKRIARQTRTQTDDLMVSILAVNEERIVEAVLQLSKGGDRLPTEAEVAEALTQVGIRADKQ